MQENSNLTKYLIKDNQAGFPCKTYYRIENELGEIFHFNKDNKWRKKSLKDISTYSSWSKQTIINRIMTLLEGINPKVYYSQFAYKDFKFSFADKKYITFVKQIKQEHPTANSCAVIKLFPVDFMDGNYMEMIDKELSRI